MKWLKENLVFPFEVVRKEDDDGFFMDIAGQELFSVDHQMTVVELSRDDDGHGIIVRAREGNQTGHVPLCDLEVTPPGGRNFWPVREYVVWFANR
jgi:hypothetical protein